MKRKAIVASLSALALAFGLSTQAGAVATSGTMFFTTFAGGQNVNKVSFSYNGTNSFTLGTPSGVASTPGADGIIFAPDGDLLVGGQGNAVYKVNPTTGTFTGVNAGGTNAFHIMLDPNKTQAWTSGIPGTPATIPLSPSFANGTAHPLAFASGAPAFIDTIAWDKSGNAFYTSSGSGGFGTFGKIDLTTFVVTPEITGLPAAHGMSFDPFSGDLILFGDNHISQIDPLAPTVLKSDFTGFGGTFDQGSVDGKGNIFAANNDGNLVFMDYSGSGLVGSGTNFVSNQFLAGALDDVAPLAGPGSNPQVPEPGTLLLVGSGIIGLAGFRKYMR